MSFENSSYIIIISNAKITIFDKSKLNIRILSVSENNSCIKETKQLDNDTVGSDKILEASLSECGRYFVSADDFKRLRVWNTVNDWKVVSDCVTKKRVTCLKFIRDEVAKDDTKDDKNDAKDCNSIPTIIIADKSGDVYSFDANSNVQHLEYGHISTVLDMDISIEHDIIVTCDRDNKIRMTRITNPSVIEAFSHEHDQMVTSLKIYEKYIFSGSMDGFFKIWDTELKKSIYSYDTKLDIDDISSGTVISGIVIDGCDLAISYHKSNIILKYTVDISQLISPRLELPTKIQLEENLVKGISAKNGILRIVDTTNLIISYNLIDMLPMVELNEEIKQIISKEKYDLTLERNLLGEVMEQNAKEYTANKRAAEVSNDECQKKNK